MERELENVKRYSISCGNLCSDSLEGSPTSAPHDLCTTTVTTEPPADLISSSIMYFDELDTHQLNLAREPDR